MSVRRSLFVLLVLSISLPLLVFTVRANQNGGGSLELDNIQLYRVSRGDLEVAVSAIGTIEPDEIVNLSFVVPGRVSEVFVQPGDYVLAGDVLVQLRNDTQRIAYEQATLALESAELQLEDLLTPDANAIKIVEANVDSAWGAYMSVENAVTDEDIRAAELAYQQAYQAWQDAINIRNQTPGGTTDTAYTLLDAQVGAASFDAEIARLQLESLKTGSRPQLNAAYARVIQAQRELDRMKAGPTEYQIEQAQIAIDQAQSAVDRTDAAFKRTMLTAPFDGVVSIVNAEVGGLVAPGSAVIQVTDVAPLHLNIQVDEIDIGLIREQLPARVQLDALPRVSLPALLEQIALVGRNDGGIVSYDVKVTLDSSDPRARVGMTAEATIVVEERKDVLLIPNLYIRLDRQTDQAYVNVLRDDGSVEEVEVTLGLRGQETSEVLSGLREGDLILIDLSSDNLSLF
jgi:HlyD family secretion protein